jgi:hypothetical protein
MKNRIDQLVEFWLSDQAFRAEFRSNPQAAATSRGLDLDAETLAAAKSIQMTTAELDGRIALCCSPPTNSC